MMDKVEMKSPTIGVDSEAFEKSTLGGADNQEPITTSTPDANKAQLLVQYTYFDSVKAKTGKLKTDTWAGVIELISNAPKYSQKTQQPLLKLGTFTNNSRSPENHLIEISGIEIDYDAGEVSIQEAAERLAGIEALVYSTFTSTEENPKFRVLIPLAKKTSAVHRSAWVAAADSALGQIAARESYTDKQLFFFGQGGGDYQVVHCQGDYLDTVQAMQVIADQYANQPEQQPAPEQQRKPPRPIRNDYSVGDLVAEAEEALNYLDSGMQRDDWLKIIAALHDLGDSGYSLALAWSSRWNGFKQSKFDAEWNSFNTHRSVQLNTVFWYARQNPEYVALKSRESTNQYEDEQADKPQQDNASYHEEPTGTPNQQPTPPQPLPPDLPPVLSFDYDTVPNSIGAWVQDAALRMSAAADFIVTALLVELGAVIGRKVAIRPLEEGDWAIVPNLWALHVGRPSSKKSPSLAAAGKFRERLEAAACRKYEEAHEEYEAQAKITELMQKEVEAATKQTIKRQLKAGEAVDVSALAKGLELDLPEKPVHSRYSTNDVTPPSLIELMRENPNGILAIRDELAGLLKECDTESGAGKRELLLQAWNGYGQYITDRIGRGMALTVRGLCLSLVGGTQPTKIASYIKSAISGGAGDDGLMQRFSLTVWPDMLPFREHDQPPDKALAAELHRIFKRLDELTPESVRALQDVDDDDGSDDGLPYLRFDYEAQALFSEWRRELNVRVRGDDIHPAMESHLIKYEKLVPALALIFHLVEVGHGPVGADSLYRSLAWAEYLETHANRLYSSVTMGKVAGAKAILSKIKAGKLSNPFKARDVYNSGWTGLDKDSTNEALNLLVDYFWLEEHEPENKRGRPTTEFYLNPLAGGML